MKNSLLTLTLISMKQKKWDAYYVSVSNENLYEFTEVNKNLVCKLTGFTGDTGSILIYKNKVYLYVDGRFIIQAKSEISDKRIKIIEANKNNTKIEHMHKVISIDSVLAMNYKLESTKFILKLKENLKNVKIVNCDNKFNDNIDFTNKEENVFILNQKYITKSTKTKILELLYEISNNGFYCYITSNLEEIAYITNLRKKPIDGFDEKILIDAFMIISKECSYLYADCYFDEKIVKTLKRNNIFVKKYNNFYSDLIKIASDKQKVCIDPKLNNYFIYTIIEKHCKNKDFVINSPLKLSMSIKGEKEIRGLEKANILDGIAITKSIYAIKNAIRNNNKLTEYDAKLIVDNYRKIIGKKYFIAPSFATIVAFKENSAICHYIPKDALKSKKISDSGVLLIDSGGNYLFGTTDITRTISLYKDKKRIPQIIKKHYSMVLNSMVNLAIIRFPYGLTGSEIDIIARQNLYNEYLDFNHGTGHGIGFVSNVHEGPNRIGPGITSDYEYNIIEPGQVCSDEPGMYIENKYGIRIENDLIATMDKENEFGNFIRFDTLSICPFDRDLIDKKYLDKKVIDALNKYNKLLFKKLYSKLNKMEQKMLLYDIQTL